MRCKYGKATVGKRKVLRTLRLRREAVRSLVDTSDHSEVRLQSDQLGLINCFHEAPFWRKAASRMDPLAEETGVDGFKALLGFFLFFLFFLQST